MSIVDFKEKYGKCFWFSGAGLSATNISSTENTNYLENEDAELKKTLKNEELISENEYEIAADNCDSETKSFSGTWFRFSGVFKKKQINDRLQEQFADSDIEIHRTQSQVVNDFPNSSEVDAKIVEDPVQDTEATSDFQVESEFVGPVESHFKEIDDLLKLSFVELDDSCLEETEMGNQTTRISEVVEANLFKNLPEKNIIEISDEEIIDEVFINENYNASDFDFEISIPVNIESLSHSENLRKPSFVDNVHTSSLPKLNENQTGYLHTEFEIDDVRRINSYENNINEGSFLTEEEESLEDALIDSDYSTSEDDVNLSFQRGTSFRRSIVIEDEERISDKQSGPNCVSVFFQPVQSFRNETGQLTFCDKLKQILLSLDRITVNEENFLTCFEAVKELNAVFWELKDSPTNEEDSNMDNLSTVLNFLVVNEWPKIFLKILRELSLFHRHVFTEYLYAESVVYYSGHLPSMLRMNRTSTEYAVSVIFDGLLKAATNFTDLHEASRLACCDCGLVSFLVDEILPHLLNIKWAKLTAREAFLKSICDLLYNCAQLPGNTSFMIQNVQTFSGIFNETFHVVEARKVNMTLLLSMSFLIDDRNHNVIAKEASILRLLQFIDKSIEHSEHTVHDFYAAELADCLTRLASHQIVRATVARNSGHEILHKLLKHSYDNEERISACNALWSVAFGVEGREMIRGMSKLIHLLHKLKVSDDVTLQRAATGVLWECFDKYDLKVTRASSAKCLCHVMLSYERSQQPLAIRVRENLQECGVKVWMNGFQDDRGITEIMTRGVERATVVLATVTRKYSQTPELCAELSYAHQLRVPLIPMIIDDNFAPDGFLGEATLSRLAVDFTGSFSQAFRNLQRSLKTVTSSSQSSSVTTGDQLTWSNYEVVAWLKKNQLLNLIDNLECLEKISGRHLLMLFNLKKESPEFYNSVLFSNYGVKNSDDVTMFSDALCKLLTVERLI